MNEQKNVLPVDFDGVFRFTNSSDVDFTAKWGGIAYTFPAQKTTPMIISGATPEEVQHIRKKFAKEYAEQMWYGTEKFKSMNNVVPGGLPALYTDSDLQPFIQTCLEPLPIARATAVVLPKDTETRFRKDNKGKNVTKVLADGESLLGDEGLEME